ncbi:MAG TPA: FKBP-type peptidyl-prolyl cis-trans isomerase [Terriglobales bacterium]|jgi:FKBP-type peptidyl-prolyl cis-trans isomerase FklB|nr:FKBP-type peptidyl-prolyl cis-trans isomerase [Terriglobales bacterium]
MKKSALAFACILVFATAFEAGPAVAQNSATTNNSAAPAAKPQTSSTAKTRIHSTAKAAPAGTAHSSPLLSTQKAKTSYAIGINLGKGLHHQSLDVDPVLVSRGLKDGLAGGKALMTDEEIQATLMQLQAQMSAKQQEQLKQMGDTNKKNGDAFLAANKSKQGVVTLPSGLQYKVLTQGTGPKPTAGDTVSCNYRGTFLDGTEFDSSSKYGHPISFPVSGVIKGWTEALQLMPVGSKWQLYIPGNLAYGENGTRGIPPSSTLIFDVELVSIEAKK